MKNTKRSMLVSGLCLLLTAVMLMGSTFAWFTDSVTNEGNKIQSGTLDVSLTPDGSQKLFGSDPDFLFEPGRSQMKAVTVSNEGSLWLKYTMSFANVKVTDSKAGSNADITEVLDVYKVPGNAATAADLNETTYLGTMKSLMAAGFFAAKDTPLAPKGQNGSQETFTLVIKMQESADNQYQGCSVSFDVVVNATQYNKEEDGFGKNDYDKDILYIPDEVQAMAADLDVVTDAGAGPVNDSLILQYGDNWLSEKGVSIAYVAGFKDGKFVVRAKPTTKVEANLIYVVMNVRNESGITEKVGEWDNPAWDGNSGNNNSVKGAVKALSDGWYEYSLNTYGMGDTLGYTIGVGYRKDNGANNGEAYVKNGTGWNWADYIHVENKCNTTKVVDDTTTLANAVTKAEPGDTIILSQNVTLTETLLVNKSITIDGNGYTICHSGEGYAFNNNAQETINLVVKNCVFEKPEGTWANTVVTGITYENCTFRGGNVYVTPTAANSGIRIVNCTFDDAMLTIDFMNTTKADLLTAELKGNTFLVKTPYDNKKMHTGVGVVFFIQDDSGYYTQDSSKVSITMEDNAFCNETGTDTFCAYQTIQTWDGSLTELSDVPVYSENTFDEGAVYAWANYSPWAAWTAEAE